MIPYYELLIAFFISLIATFLLTYPIKKLAYKWGTLDFPNHRKIHHKVTPRLGGLAIFLGALIGILYLQPQHEHMIGILSGASVILMTGLLDDRFNIRPVIKLTGQLIATSLLLSSGLIIERITLPIIGVIDLGIFSVLVTIIWVVGITNAINFIDGLDGLATGITTIGLISLFIMALIDTHLFVATLCIVLIGANLGFLYHNFYPAKIYMGDGGSNFLGFMIAIISMLGLFKNVALFSFIIPIIILAVPILDTAVTVIRRLYHKENIARADNRHIHYQLIYNGYTHRQAVLIIYIFSGMFGLLAIFFAKASMMITVFIFVVFLIILHILAEISGLVLDGRRPVINFFKRRFKKRKTINK